MLSVRRVSVALLAVVGLVWAVSSFAAQEWHSVAGRNDTTVTTATSIAEVPSGEETLLAARYHLRSRTSRFFQRAGSSDRGRSGSKGNYRGYRSGRRRFGAVAVEETQQLAARYHLRSRTSRFFRRAVGSGHYGSYRSGDSRIGAVGANDTDLLAARYHLRGRTARFFRRAIG